jgi:hypothetical protein
VAFGGRYPQKGTELFPSAGNPTKVSVTGADPTTPEGAAALREVTPFAQGYYTRAAHNFSLSTVTYQKTSTRTLSGDKVTVVFNGADTLVTLAVAPRENIIVEDTPETAAVWLFDARDFEDARLSPDYYPQALLAEPSPGMGPGVWTATKYPWREEGPGEVGQLGGCVAPNGIDAVSWNRAVPLAGDTFTPGAFFSKGRQIGDLTWIDAAADTGEAARVKLVNIMFGRVFVYTWDDTLGVVLGSFDLDPEPGVINQNPKIHHLQTTQLVSESGEGLPPGDPYPTDGSAVGFDYLLSASNSPDGLRMVVVWWGPAGVDIALTPPTEDNPEPGVVVTPITQLTNSVVVETRTVYGVAYTTTAPDDDAGNPAEWYHTDGSYTDTTPPYDLWYYFAPEWDPLTGHEFHWVRMRIKNAGHVKIYEAEYKAYNGHPTNPSNTSVTTARMDDELSEGFVVFPDGASARVYSREYKYTNVEAPTRALSDRTTILVWWTEQTSRGYDPVGPHLQDGHRHVGPTEGWPLTPGVDKTKIHSIITDSGVSTTTTSRHITPSSLGWDYKTMWLFNNQEHCARQAGSAMYTGGVTAYDSPDKDDDGLMTIAVNADNTVVDIGEVLSGGEDDGPGSGISGEWYSRYLVPW